MGKKKKEKATCPCGSGVPFEKCCGPYLSGEQLPETAEQLMRSRYTAYTLKDEDYILKTWHNSTRPKSLSLEEDKPIKWIRLEVFSGISGGEKDSEGYVEFMAHYKLQGKAQRLYEMSHFLKEKGKWYYVDGKHPD